MSHYCLETQAISHHYSSKAMVLDRLDLKVPTGSIFGFLGPNGAGKTTTLRLVLGLLKKQQGNIVFFGRPFEPNRVDILKRVGSLIESPSIYGHLSAVDNLRLLQRVYHCPEERIALVLELTGLADTGRKKAGQFSLGMKQRLGMAIALLNEPELLILDEPTNGLDPAGIIELRDLLKTLNRERGVTILVSSHLLAEMQRLVTHTAIIHKGKLLYQGTLAELKRSQQTTDLETIFINLTKS